MIMRQIQMLSWAPAWIASCIPLLCLATFFIYASVVRIGLGHWPTPMTECYTTPLVALLHPVSGCLLVATLWAPLAWIAVILIPGLSPQRSALLAQATLLITASYLMILFWMRCPGDFMSWVLD